VRAALLVIELHVRVALCPIAGADGGAPAPAVTDAWLDQHLAAANALLGAHDIQLRATRDLFTPARCEALTAAERDGFAPDVEPYARVTVLVVPRVRDLDVPTYDLKGVHWRAAGKRWLFLTARARPPTLAHELGHYFGLPHDPSGGNLMTPGPSSPLWRSAAPPRPFAARLTPAQVRKLRAGIARHLRAERRRR
jgi:hypothetical protein